VHIFDWLDAVMNRIHGVFIGVRLEIAEHKNNVYEPDYLPAEVLQSKAWFESDR